ncbi:MAG: ankyrin repeat domain-containing protein [Gammaproteobacteria bacterium]|nr:ankyrin repeat domain-containing protein [Gammaproteobacteria bacterium]
MELFNLSHDLLKEISEYLYPSQIIKAALANKKMQASFQDNLIWKRKLEKYFPREYVKNKTHSNFFELFKEIYISKYEILDYPAIRLFLMVGEEDIFSFSRLTITMQMLEITNDAEDNLFYYIMEKNNQQFLDMVYQKIKPYYIIDNQMNVRFRYNAKSILYWAVSCHQKYNEVIKPLLAAGSIMSEKYLFHGITPIHIAALRGWNDLLISLLNDYPESINQQTVFEITPIACAIKNGLYQTAKILFERGAKLSDESFSNALHFAVESESLEMVEWVYSIYPHLLDEPDRFNVTPLCLAAQKDDEKIMLFLIKKGADFDVAYTRAKEDKDVSYTMDIAYSRLKKIKQKNRKRKYFQAFFTPVDMAQAGEVQEAKRLAR